MTYQTEEILSYASHFFNGAIAPYTKNGNNSIKSETKFMQSKYIHNNIIFDNIRH